jgi:quercetin dioxygenase-like cupin family protein
MELIRANESPRLENSGVASHQLLFPENSRSQRITITRVVLQPGAKNPPHRHKTSEQVWVALRGAGQLMLDEGTTLAFAAGDTVRFEDGELHGFENTGDTEFEYISVTAPPANFRAAYAADWSKTKTP